MFFGGEGDTTNATESSRYYYTTPYTTRVIVKHIDANNKDKAIQVPIYWMWPNTLGQIALTSNSNSQLNGIALVSDVIPEGESENAEKAALKSYLNTNKTSVFNGVSSSDLTTALANPDLPANFKTLSTGYNNADRIIGTKVAYFMIEITAESAD